MWIHRASDVLIFSKAGIVKWWTLGGCMWIADPLCLMGRKQIAAHAKGRKKADLLVGVLQAGVATLPAAFLLPPPFILQMPPSNTRGPQAMASFLPIEQN